MRISTNKIKSVADFFRTELKNLYSESEISEFIFLSFNYYLNFSKTDLTLKSDNTLSESELLKFTRVVKELKQEKPIQYVLGETEFCGLKFIVNENVLIPRPETEELIRLIVKENQDKGLRILDIGTGSGCIAIAIKKMIPMAQVSAIDISDKALEVAVENAKINNAEINFIQADILSQLLPLIASYDIIVSNPPYVTLAEKSFMQKNVLNFEPHTALFVADSNPLLFYEAIAKYSFQVLNPNGKLYFELNEKYAVETVRVVKKHGFGNAKIVKDINNKNRILVCQKNIGDE